MYVKKLKRLGKKVVTKYDSSKFYNIGILIIHLCTFARHFKEGQILMFKQINGNLFLQHNCWAKRKYWKSMNPITILQRS